MLQKVIVMCSFRTNFGFQMPRTHQMPTFSLNRCRCYRGNILYGSYLRETCQNWEPKPDSGSYLLMVIMFRWAEAENSCQPCKEKVTAAVTTHRKTRRGRYTSGLVCEKREQNLVKSIKSCKIIKIKLVFCILGVDKKWTASRSSGSWGVGDGPCSR